MPAWVWVGLALLFFCGGCFALVWAAILGGARHDQRIDDTAGDGPDMDEFELRAHMAYDRYRFQYKAPGERS